MRMNSRQMMAWLLLGAVVVTGLGASLVWAQSATSTDPLAEYREMLSDDNPAALWIEEGSARRHV